VDFTSNACVSIPDDDNHLYSTNIQVPTRRQPSKEEALVAGQVCNGFQRAGSWVQDMLSL
jgi:hypothetical protein